MDAQLATEDAGMLGVAKTLFMEERSRCGPALCLDAAPAPLSQQVSALAGMHTGSAAMLDASCML